MHSLRFLGGLFAIFITLAITYFTGIDWINIVAMSAFVLTVDNLIIKYLSKLYMKAVMQNIVPRDKDDK